MLLRKWQKDNIFFLFAYGKVTSIHESGRVKKGFKKEGDKFCCYYNEFLIAELISFLTETEKQN